MAQTPSLVVWPYVGQVSPTGGSDLSPATLSFRTAPDPLVKSFTFGAMGDGRGGGSTPSAATGFEYTDPTNTGWRLQRNAALSTPTHLVLELWAPAGEQGTGTGLVLAADPAQCAWAKVAASDGTPAGITVAVGPLKAK